MSFLLTTSNAIGQEKKKVKNDTIFKVKSINIKEANQIFVEHKSLLRQVDQMDSLIDALEEQKSIIKKDRDVYKKENEVRKRLLKDKESLMKIKSKNYERKIDDYKRKSTYAWIVTAASTIITILLLTK